MRCRLGEKKLRSYSKKFGKDFTLGLVRGNTGHRVDLYTAEESFSYYPCDGLILNKDEKGRPRETIPTYGTTIDFIVTIEQTNTNVQKGE